MPLLFLMTAVMLGFCAVIFEATLSAVGFKRHLETPLVGRVCDVLWGLLVAYMILRVGDLFVRGAIGHAFAPTKQALAFWIETVLFVVPAVMLAGKPARRHPGKLFVGAVLLMVGGMVHRINAYLVGYMTGEGWSYFPSLPELTVTVGLIAAEILAYIVIVRRFPVLPAEAAPSR
jgi:Ni/Fe-hydrogenase subunit HybB-like protein